MDSEKFWEHERRSLDKITFLLPNYCKKIAVFLFVFALAIVFGIMVFTDHTEHEVMLSVGKNLVLISMLMFALSKEELEDEMIVSMRARAFSAAFVVGALYTIFQPYVNYVVGLLFNPDSASYAELGDFIIIWFMLFNYIGFFHLLKKVSQ